MDKKKCIDYLKDLINHSDDCGADFGWLSCCNQRDYKGRAKDCERVQALTYAIKVLESEPDFTNLRIDSYNHKIIRIWWHGIPYYPKKESEE